MTNNPFTLSLHKVQPHEVEEVKACADAWNRAEKLSKRLPWGFMAKMHVSGRGSQGWYRWIRANAPEEEESSYQFTLWQAVRMTPAQRSAKLQECRKMEAAYPGGTASKDLPYWERVCADLGDA